MLQPHQLEPAARRLLDQAAAPLRTGERHSPVLFLHAPGTWVMLGLNLRSEEELSGCLREGFAAVELHTVDAYMLLVAAADVARLGPALELEVEPVGGDGGALALVGASRAGDSVTATARAEADWALEPADEPGLEAVRDGLAQLLLAGARR